MLQRLHRDRLNLNVPVCSAGGGAMLGRLYDLSMGGFSLAGAGVPPKPSLTALELRLPWKVLGHQCIHVTVEQRWAHQGNGGRWRVGYRIVNCPAGELVALNQLSASGSSPLLSHF